MGKADALHMPGYSLDTLCGGSGLWYAQDIGVQVCRHCTCKSFSLIMIQLLSLWTGSLKGGVQIMRARAGL